MSSVRTLKLALLGSLALLAYSAPALAAFGPSTLVSSPTPAGGALQTQADYAFDPAISADGRYVAFTGSFNSVTGVYRKNLATGALDLVAGGDAGAPSISADGRYVSFTTTANLSGGVANGCSNVWVRDMSVNAASTSPAAYTIASAPSGSEEPLTYTDGASPAGCPGHAGSAAAARVALSADGRQVAFTVIDPSNLTGPDPSQWQPDQVAVRDLDTRQTTLVSATLASEQTGQPAPVVGGATVSGALTGSSVVGNVPIGDSTASISADGTTVAWMGVNVPDQTPPIPFPPGPYPAFHGSGPGQFGYVKGCPPQPYCDNYTTPAEYDEPLWRRIADSPTGATRRILGGNTPMSADPLDLQFNSFLEASVPGPIYGSYIAESGFGSSTAFADKLDNATPQLSANGTVVALLSTAPTRGQDPVFPAGASLTTPPSANAFVVNMAPGVAHNTSLDRLTEWASTDFGDFALAGSVNGIAISPDGEHIAFTTNRISFPFSPPALIGAPANTSAYTELYEVDLAAGTLSLVSNGYDGNAGDGSANEPSFSADGNTLAFASSADNLAFGAYNGASSVFTIHDAPAPGAPGQTALGQAPAAAPVVPSYQLSATVHPSRDGSLLLDVSVPGAGSLVASASAAVPVVPPATQRSRRAAARRRQARAHKSAKARTRIVTRVVARTRGEAHGAGVIELRLRPLAAYRALADTSAGLYANLQLTFTAAGQPKLSDTLQASFPRVRASDSKSRARARATPKQRTPRRAQR